MPKHNLPISGGFYLTYDECQVHSTFRPASQVEFSRSLAKLKKDAAKRERLYKKWNNGRFTKNVRFFEVTVKEIQ